MKEIVDISNIFYKKEHTDQINTLVVTWYSLFTISDNLGNCRILETIQHLRRDIQSNVFIIREIFEMFKYSPITCSKIKDSITRQISRKKSFVLIMVYTCQVRSVLTIFFCYSIKSFSHTKDRHKRLFIIGHKINSMKINIYILIFS